MPRQDDLNSVLVNDLTGLKSKLEGLAEAIGAMGGVLEALLVELDANGGVARGPEGILARHRRLLRDLARRGAIASATGTVVVECPGCGARLKGLTGDPGETCGWCGHVLG